MPNEDEIELNVDRARGGDNRALTELFECHRDRLERMVRLRMDRRVQARVAVSDVLQEAYVDLAGQLGNYAKSPDLPFFLWLRRITWQRLAKIHRMHLGQAKRDAARERRLDGNGAPEASSVFMASELVARVSSPSERVIRGEANERVRQALDAMPEDQREIIALRHAEQLTNQEVALILGVSENLASKRYTRALRRLRESLKDVPGLLD